VLVGMGQAAGAWFVLAMLLGMWLARPLIKWLS
jgi:hypothetical protein